MLVNACGAKKRGGWIARHPPPADNAQGITNVATGFELRFEKYRIHVADCLPRLHARATIGDFRIDVAG